jgi:hypothetical protein
MDPFLEHPVQFPDLHDRLITYSSEALNGRLPEPYYAKIGRRVWVEVSQRYVGPDVNVLRTNGGPAREQLESGGVAVAAPPRTRPVVVRVPHDEIRETFLDIYTRQDGERLVTSIEVLSPSNKTPGEQGRALYQQKQQEVLRSKVHLVEIDLLRGGTHTTAVPLDRAVGKCGPFDYHVCVHPFDDFEVFHVYPIRLADRLPEISVPLLPGHDPVTLDLQAVFDRCYDTGGYRRHISYDLASVVPPLRPEHGSWAVEMLARR